MRIKLKWVIVIESVVILVLLAIVLNSHSQEARISKQPKTGLLSPRIYTGLLEPKSYIIVNFVPLKHDLEFYIRENNLNASVYVENLRNGAFMGIDEKAGFFPTSLNKLPVAILIMKKVEGGELSLDSMLPIRDIDMTDSSGDLYKTKEKELPLRIVLEKLLKESDNTALRVLLHQLDLEDLQLVLDYYGIDITIENQKGITQNNMVTPKSISNLFISLYFSTVLEPHNSEYILSLLEDTVFDAKKIAGIPDSVTIAHKFGENYRDDNKFFHDCGIMYINESRIFYCIMTKNLDEDDAERVIGSITNEIYNYVVITKSKYQAFKNS